MATVDDLMREVVTLRKEVRRLQRKHQPTNEEQVAELIGDGDNADDRSGGRLVQGGFSGLAKKVIQESDKRRRAHEDHVAKHGYVR